MIKHCRAIVALVALACIPAQDPKPPQDHAAWLDLIQRATLASADTARGLADLEHAIAADYASAHAAWRSLPEGKARNTMAELLSLPRVAEAELVVRGRIARVETDQGGVVDYHWLRVTFDPFEVVKAPPDQRRELDRQRTVTVLRGTSWDAWLAQALRRDLEQLKQTGEVRTFVFVARDLLHPARDGGAERGLRLLEYRTLPSAAADALR